MSGSKIDPRTGPPESILTSRIKFDTSDAAQGRQNPDQTLIRALRLSAPWVIQASIIYEWIYMNEWMNVLYINECIYTWWISSPNLTTEASVTVWRTVTRKNRENRRPELWIPNLMLPTIKSNPEFKPVLFFNLSL